MLTIVIPVHDPAYGGDLVRRAQVCLDAFLGIALHHGAPCELLFVEWNPLPGTPRIRELLTLPDRPAPAEIRFVEVPLERHAATPESHLRPFQSAAARNVGVRRARGTDVLVTGADSLPSASLVAFLAAGAFADHALYRIDRRDLAGELPHGLPVAVLERLAASHDQEVNAFYGTIRERGRRGFRGGILGRVSARRRHAATLAAYRRLSPDPAVTPDFRPARGDRLLVPADGLHRNGAADFLLMSRTLWHDLRAFTELPTRGHTDSIMCWTAASAGVRQVILSEPLRLYHQHHDREASSGWPVTDWRPWYARYQECLLTGERLIENGEDWGLAGVQLPEWTHSA